MHWIENKAAALAWSQQHTARLLGIKDNAKVTYALQIADELKQDPTGLMAQCEKYSDATKMLIERTERQSRAEQEKRREILVRIENKLMIDNSKLDPTQPIEHGEITYLDEGLKYFNDKVEAPTTIWLSNMLYLGDFASIAETDFPPDVYPCVLALGEGNGDLWIPQAFRLLKADGFLIWDDWRPRSEAQKYVEVLWSVIGMEPNPDTPFRDNTQSIAVFLKGNPRSPCPSASRVVSANDTDSGQLPMPVLDFLLRATTIPGDSILMPCGGPVATILELGRRPICFDVDEETHLKHMEEAKAYYTNLYLDDVTFK
jgi:hypothetical protein